MRQTITPYLLYEEAAAAGAWLQRAFGFQEIDRQTGAAGGMHLELEVAAGDGRVYAGSPPDGFQSPAKVGRTSLLYVLVADVDAHYERAKAAGAEIVEEPTNAPYGDRRCTCRDPEGHEWCFASPLGETAS
jgi:PhnB protein